MSERMLFYPWLRQGWSGASLPADVVTDGTGGATGGTASSSLAARVKLPVHLRVNSATVEHHVALLGPADVIGIERQQIIRTDPAPLARASESNFFASVDFDRPDFPWLFTPAAATAQHRLRPWICLVVVRKQDGVALTVNPRRPLPVLTIASPAVPGDELPDLTHAWAWAHAQVASFTGPLDAELQAHPERSLSRLICPRHLEPGTTYLACVVPVFDAGRVAGLGHPVTPAVLGSLATAWTSGAASPESVELPVYHSWEFATGPAGDFASLAALLRARPLDSATGMADLDVGEAGEGLPPIAADSPDRVLRLEGALLSPAAARTGFTTTAGAAFQQRLAALITQPASPDEDPIVGPTVYGDRAADVNALPAAGTSPQWLRDLNIDPRYRVVSALGRQVVQQHQDAILASVVQQSGDIERANTLLRHTRLAHTVSDAVVRRRFAAMPEATVLQLTRAVQGRMMTGGTTVRQAIDLHTFADAATLPAFRRVARPRGPAVRSVLPSTGRTVLPTFTKLATNLLTVKVTRAVGGLVTLEAVESRFRQNGGSRPAGQSVAYSIFQHTAIATLQKVPAFTVRTPEPLQPANAPVQALAPFGATDSFSAGRLRAAAVAHQPKLNVPPLIIFAPPVPLNVVALGESTVASLSPASTMLARLHKIIAAPASMFPGPSAPSSPGSPTPPAPDPFDPILATPEIERPMYEPLRDLFPRLLLPGLGRVEDNSAALLVTNPRFVEAFLVGVNHELGRELLWRGFPARSRFSFFRRFWDRRGQPGQTQLPADVPPIGEWPGEKRLGEIAEGASGQVVVLLRGELTRRYPNMLCYLAKARRVQPSGPLSIGTTEVHPSFRGTLGDDVMFFGFALGEAAVRGTASDPGWFLVIQQPPGEPRFGVDAAATTPAFVPPAADAAQTARQFLRKPVRVAIHANALLPPSASSASPVSQASQGGVA